MVAAAVVPFSSIGPSHAVDADADVTDAGVRGGLVHGDGGAGKPGGVVL